MKKIIIWSMIFALICCGCSNEKKEDKNNNEEYSEEYIETIPDDAKEYIKDLSKDVLLSVQDIQKYNSEIQSKTDTMYDLDKKDKLTKKEILEYINSYEAPSLPKYNVKDEIKEPELQAILDNRNLDEVVDKDPVPKGIIVNRSNLRSFPTKIHFYNKDENEVDTIQESELHINTPVLVIHESKDKKWYFVITPIYIGWVKEEDVAFATDEDIKYFIDNDKFAIITEPVLRTGTTVLDMSVKLPYDGVTELGYKLVLPKKGDNKFVEKQEFIVSRNKAHIGYLPYNYRNVYIQALKYKDIKYSWGGMDDGVDCSSFVVNVYRTFGFIFPRNTVNQKDSVGEIISLSGKSIDEKKELLSKNYPSLIYQPGHVMIFLGVKDDKYYMIHSSGNDKKVTVTELNDTSSYLSAIDRLILIK